MKRFSNELVADGVIDAVNAHWQMLREIDKATGRDRYNIYIRGQYCGAFPTIKDALEVIVNHFG